MSTKADQAHGNKGALMVALVLDDAAQVLDVLCLALRRKGHQALRAMNDIEALSLSTRFQPDVAFLDLAGRDHDGLAIFRSLRRDSPELIGIIVTGSGNISSAFQSGQLGIAAYIETPFNPDSVVTLAETVLAQRAARRDQSSLATAEPYEGMIGSSCAMRDIFRRLEKVAALDQPVLIQGETGTGKELVARAIHNRSLRHKKPFVDINCSAVPTSLFEAEFFGHERGAFTDAKEARRGKFEQADGGTLFLDEIGDLPAESQAKLLRAIELGEVTRLGASRPTQVNVRFLSATNVDLEAAVAQNTFRADLYWRLKGLTIRLPPLRLRRDDLTSMISVFLQRLSDQHRLSDIQLSDDARHALLTYDWPGNVRELRWALGEAVVATNTNIITLQHLPEKVQGAPAESALGALPFPEGISLSEALRRATSRLERQWLLDALHAHPTLSAAAKALGIDVMGLIRFGGRFSYAA